MITANSTSLHRVDTTLSGRGERTNLNWPTTRPGPLVDSDLQHLDDTPVPPPAVRCAPRRRLSLIVRAWRWLRRRELQSKLDALISERTGYQAVATSRGVTLGRQYLSACAEQERDLRSRIAMLEVE